MHWTFDSAVDAYYIMLKDEHGHLVTLDLSDVEVHLDIDQESGTVSGIEILGDGTGGIAKVLARYLKDDDDRQEGYPCRS